MFSRRVPAEISEREPERLKVLASFNIMDTPPEAEYDDLTAFAASAYDVPFAQVSLVDSTRQFIKSSNGCAALDTPREHSFCAHAVASKSTQLVPDARIDSRFRDNPLVLKGPHIRFYAGAPLLVRNGFCLGTLCIISGETRTNLDEQEVALLEKLARLAAQHIEQRLPSKAQSSSHQTSTLRRHQFLLLNEELTPLYASPTLGSLPGVDVVQECEALACLIRASQKGHIHLSQPFRVDDVFLEVEVYPLRARSAVIIRDITAEYLDHSDGSRLDSILKANSPLTLRYRPGALEYDGLREWLDFTGQEFSDFHVGMFLSAVHPDDVHNGREAFRMGATEVNQLIRIRRFDGDFRWMRSHVIPRIEPDQTISEWIGILADVTESYAAQEEAWEANERFTLVTEATSDAIFDLDCRSGQTFFSSRWTSLFGPDTFVSFASLEDLLARFHPEDRRRFDAGMELLENRHSDTLQFDGRCWTSAYSFRWISIHAVAQRDGLGNLVRVTGAARDITERKTIDPLTGLLNRQAILDAIQSRIDLAVSRLPQIGIFFLDIDFFKRINDSMGHDVGDALLQAISQRLSDTVQTSNRDLVARVGGDEFVVFVSKFDEVSDALIYASMLEYVLATPIEVRGRSIQLSMSVGISTAVPRAGMHATDLLEQADIAMYSAKREGRSRFVLYSAAMKEEAIQRVELEQDLRNALRQGEFNLYYQPVVEVGTGRLHGLEALIRWRHPAKGVIGPSTFIPIAEETGQIVAIGNWVFKEAVTQIGRWRASRLVPPTATVSVNISAQMLQRKDYCRSLVGICEAAHVPTNAVILEVTESVFLSDSFLVTGTLAELSQAGFALDLDDFGTGYSSLSYLHKHKFDRVKIDQSFVGEMEKDQRSLSLVSTIIGMAQALGMAVVAEGVENLDQLRILQELGCKYAQGYFFSPPSSTQQLEAGKLREMTRSL